MCIPRLFMRGSKKLAAAELWKNGLVGVWLFTATLGTSVFFSRQALAGLAFLTGVKQEQKLMQC